MSDSSDTLGIRRNRVEITKFDRERGWCWYGGKKYPVAPSPYLYIAVMPDENDALRELERKKK